MMSGEARTPSTAGFAKAICSRSSRSRRSAMAIGSEPTLRAPRAGWSAATMKFWVPYLRPGWRRRAAAARATASGSSSRMALRCS